MRKTFIKTSSEIIKANENTALLLGDISVFGFKDLINEYPSRVINLGILEQTIVGIGAGYALAGLTPTIHTIAPFLVERAFEQIKIDFGYQNLSGNFVSVGASYDYSTLGCTHHCPGDFPLLSSIPGIQLFIPGHPDELSLMFNQNWSNKKLNYFRLSEQTNEIALKTEHGKLFKLSEGSRGTVISVGPTLKNVKSAIVNLDLELFYLNSIDTKTEIILENVQANRLIIVEPYYSGSVLKYLATYLKNNPVKILQIGVPNKFIDKYGSIDEITKFIRLDSQSIKDSIQDFVK